MWTSRKTCNFIYVSGIGFNFIQGIDYPNKNVTELNELVTDWIAYDITNIKECSIYASYYGVIDAIKDKLGEVEFRELLRTFFCNDYQKFFNLFSQAWGISAAQGLEHLIDSIERLKKESRAGIR